MRKLSIHDLCDPALAVADRVGYAKGESVMKYAYTKQKQVCEAFWRDHPQAELKALIAEG